MQTSNTKKLLKTSVAFISVIVVFVFLYRSIVTYRMQTAQVLAQSQSTQPLGANLQSNVQAASLVANKDFGLTATSVEQTALAQNSSSTVIHIPTPSSVKGLYMTSWVAGTKTLRDHVIGLLDTTEANAVVVDLKDYTGNITYPVEDPSLNAVGSVQKRMPSLKDLTSLLHSKGVYVIGRIACFQDPYFAKLHPEYAVEKKTDHLVAWKDKGGIMWLDPGEQPVWDYLISISKDAYAQGVDEVQFDYTRFPTDGNLEDVYYPASEGKDRADVINSFWQYLHKNLAGTGIVTSADLFGLTTTSKDDMGIGQVIENALTNFDYVSPMVYPSHYAPGTDGFKDPQAHPYDVVKTAIDDAVVRAKAINQPPSKLRPWLQDFGLYGETYGPKEVRAQIQATDDAGLNSWLLWDPTNKFTSQALLPQT